MGCSIHKRAIINKGEGVNGVATIWSHAVIYGVAMERNGLDSSATKGSRYTKTSGKMLLVRTESGTRQKIYHKLCPDAKLPENAVFALQILR